jgi:hypothetical protein
MSLLVGPAATAAPAPIAGILRQGERFQRAIGGGLFLRLVPQDGGWGMEIGPPGTDFASVVTPPFHGPNALQIYGWHFTRQGRGLGLGERERRHVQFVLSRAALAKEEHDLEGMLYLTGNDPEHVRAMADWGTDTLGTCWLTPDEILLGPPALPPNARGILAMRFTASCALSGGNHYIQYLP